jgi:hypothetical protein
MYIPSHSLICCITHSRGPAPIGLSMPPGSARRRTWGRSPGDLDPRSQARFHIRESFHCTPHSPRLLRRMGAPESRVRQGIRQENRSLSTCGSTGCRPSCNRCHRPFALGEHGRHRSRAPRVHALHLQRLHEKVSNGLPQDPLPREKVSVVRVRRRVRRRFPAKHSFQEGANLWYCRAPHPLFDLTALVSVSRDVTLCPNRMYRRY